MRTKRLCVLIYIRIKGEVEVPLEMLKTTSIFTVCSKACFFWGIFFCYLCVIYREYKVSIFDVKFTRQCFDNAC